MDDEKYIAKYYYIYICVKGVPYRAHMAHWGRRDTATIFL
jgi:hypothetical protein